MVQLGYEFIFYFKTVLHVFLVLNNVDSSFLAFLVLKLFVKNSALVLTSAYNKKEKLYGMDMLRLKHLFNLKFLAFLKS